MNDRHENAAENVHAQQDEEALYEIAMSEIAVHRVKKGLWAKAYAQCEGDPNRTKALYIKLRVQELKDDAAHRAQQECPRPPAPAENHPTAVEKSQVTKSKAVTKPERWKDQSKTFLGGDTHPWRRCFARGLDGSIAGIVLVLPALAFYAAMAEVYEQAMQAMGEVVGRGLFFGVCVCLIALISVPVEALFLSWIGTTPAKWLFGIRVSHPDGKLLTFSEALNRSWQVLVQGEWFGIPVVALLPALFAYQRLTKTGTTRWDTATNAVVIHKDWGVLRVLAIVVVWFFVQLLSNALWRTFGGKVYEKILGTQQGYEQSQFQSKQDATQGSAQINTVIVPDGWQTVEQLFDKASKGDTQARQALEQAAAQGVAGAQFGLGVMYYLGQGGRQDARVAKEWFGKACDAGHQDGCEEYQKLNAPIEVDNALPPVYIELPPYVKNLDPAEGERFVQAKIVLQVATDPKYSAMIGAHKPQINDVINRILATKKPSDIRTATGQEALSQEILTAINDALGYARPAQPTGPWGPVIAVLFNSLIIQ